MGKTTGGFGTTRGTGRTSRRQSCHGTESTQRAGDRSHPPQL